MSNTAPKKPRTHHQRKSQKTSPLQYVGHGEEQDRAALLESIPDAFVSVDTHWQFTYVNQHGEEVLGKTREELLGRNVWEVFPLPADSFFYLKAHEAMNQFTSLEFSQLHPLLNKWFSVRLYPFHDGLYGFGQDITERKKAGERLQFHEKTLWDASKSIIVTNLQGKIIYWNDGASLLFGYTAEEMLGKTPAILYPELGKKQLAHDLEQIRNGIDYTGVWKGQRKDGATVWLDIKTTLLRGTTGKTIGYIGIATDTTERKQAEEQFLYYARIAQSNLDAVIATDTNYNILSWNKPAERLYGWKEEEVLGKFVNDVIPTTFFATTGSEASEQLRSRGYWKGEVIQKRKDGTSVPILASVSVIKDASGKIIGALAANRDLSQLKFAVSAVEMENQLL
jgi:two-component system, sporulation sensor kinase A